MAKFPTALRRLVVALMVALTLTSPALAGKGSTFSNDLLKLIFNGTAISGVADNTATSPLTNLYVSLHTADPGAGGSQTTSEIAYTSYARVAQARTTGGWTVSGTTVVPATTISFPAGTGGSGTATFWAVGTASSGAGKILYSGAISPSIVTGAGVTPQLTTASTITEAFLRRDHRARLGAPVLVAAHRGPSAPAMLAPRRRAA